MSALIWCPFPNNGDAREAVDRLLDENLIACANLIDRVESICKWAGQKGVATETIVVFKTHISKLDAAIARLEILHPYEEPAILGWECNSVTNSTERWLGSLA